jgi:hypothetical protein
VKTVGMIGLGIMGMPMSANLLQAGFGVVGYGGPRSNAEKTAALVQLGGQGARSPREVARGPGPPARSPSDPMSSSRCCRASRRWTMLFRERTDCWPPVGRD